MLTPRVPMATVFAVWLLLPSEGLAEPNIGDCSSEAKVSDAGACAVGGPVRPELEAGIAGTVGLGSLSSSWDEIIVENPARVPASERICVWDSMGNVVCEEIRH